MKTNNKKSRRKRGEGRNWLAVHAHLRGGAGSHGDKRKEESRRACRGNVNDTPKGKYDDRDL